MRQRSLPGKMQQSRLQRDVKHLTVRHTRVAPESHRQAFVGQLLLSVSQQTQEATAGGFPGSFAITFQQIQRFPDEGGVSLKLRCPSAEIPAPGPATGWPNNRG